MPKSTDEGRDSSLEIDKAPGIQIQHVSRSSQGECRTSFNAAPGDPSCRRLDEKGPPKRASARRPTTRSGGPQARAAHGDGVATRLDQALGGARHRLDVDHHEVETDHAPIVLEKGYVVAGVKVVAWIDVVHGCLDCAPSARAFGDPAELTIYEQLFISASSSAEWRWK